MKVIPLTQGYIALVDDLDYEWASRLRWYAHVKKRKTTIVYAVRKSNQKMISMAGEIAKIAGIWVDGLEIDHIDGNRLNNQRYNLRVATGSQNQANQIHRKDTSSRYKGVSWSSKNNKWTAYIGYNKNKYNLGTYKSEEEAAKEYDLCAYELFGEYARLNFPK